MEPLEKVKHLRSRGENLLAVSASASAFAQAADQSELSAIVDELRIKENQFKALFPTFKIKPETLDELAARLDVIEERMTPA